MTSQSKTPAGGSGIHSGTSDLAEFKQGWKILLLGILGISTSVGAVVLYSFGTLVIPLEQAFGWSRSEIQASMTFFFCGAIVAPAIIGWLNLRYGLLRVSVISLIVTILGYLSFLLLPHGAAIGWLYLGFVLMPILGTGHLPVTWTQMVGLWFVRRRGLALALALSGTGITASVMPSLITWAMGFWDWRAAFLAMALLIAFLTLPLTLLWLREPPQVAAKTATGPDTAGGQLSGISFRDALRTVKFWLFNLSLAIVVSAIVCMVITAIPMLRDKGLSAADASRVFSAYGVALLLGRVGAGYLIDIVWAPVVGAVVLCLSGLGCIIFASPENSIPLLMLAAVLLGMGAGTEMNLSSFLLARYFGMRDYGRLYSFHLVFLTITPAISPLLSSGLYKLAGNYSLVLGYCAAVFISGGLALLFLGRYPKFE